MKTRKSILAVCVVSVVYAPTVQAQFLAPTPVSPGPSAPLTKAFPSAWLRIVGSERPLRSSEFPFAITVEAIPQSDRGMRVTSSTQIATRADLALVAPDGKVRLSLLPSQVPIVLRISTRDRHGVVVALYTETHELQFPSSQQVAQLGRERALEASGFLGTFFINQADGTVRRTNR